MRRWMLHGGAVLACLWVVYVFIHIDQLRVWRRQFQPNRLFSFHYSIVTTVSDVTAAPKRSKSNSTVSPIYQSLAQLPSASFKPYPPSTKTCSPSARGIIKTPFTFAELKGEVVERVQPVVGGLWRPPDCVPVNRVAVIIPYRNRSENLAMVTTHLNYFLQQQKQEYGIFVIEQADSRRFNRAKLLNVGFVFITKRYPQFDCFVLHDADKLPMDTRHTYVCDHNRPRHMIARMRNTKSPKFNKGMVYSYFFGGVSALTKNQFKKVNGMSNGYWGWGREDDDLCARLRLRGLQPSYTHSAAGIYVNIAHKSDVIQNSNPWPHMSFVRKTIDKDGLSSLNFSIKAHSRHHFFTMLSVNL